MLLKFALLAALFSTSNAAGEISKTQEEEAEKTDTAIKDNILRQNSINEAKAGVTGKTAVDLMSSAEWSPSTASTCQECVISNGSWDASVNTCTAGGGSTQEISDFLSSAADCENDQDFCFTRGSPTNEPYMKKKKKEENTYLVEADYSWSYRVSQNIDDTEGIEHKSKNAKTFKKWDMCRHQFVLPRVYSGGLGVFLQNNFDNVKTFMKVGSGDSAQYFNDHKLKTMMFGYSKSVILFDQTTFDFTFVATAPSGKNIDLYHYKIGFYRLTFKDIAHIHALKSSHTTYIFFATIVVGGTGLIGILMIIKKCCFRKAKAPKRIRYTQKHALDQEDDLYTRI